MSIPNYCFPMGRWIMPILEFMNTAKDKFRRFWITTTWTELIRQLRERTRKAGKTLSARFEYDPQSCIASGLDVETWLSEGSLDQITLGGIGDHMPDAPSDWWIERTHAGGCKVFPGIEGQLHWIPSCGSGGTGLHPGNGVIDGYGPPSIEYMRAVAAVHYRSGADGISLFNFTCADGSFARAAFTKLADPEMLERRDKQYVAAVWPWDAQIFGVEWSSRFRIDSGQRSASYPLTIADSFDPSDLSQPGAILTLDLKGINRLSDIEISINGTLLQWNGYHYNHYDHGCWNDIVQFDVPVSTLRSGKNTIQVRRMKENQGFAGAVEVRKCILDLKYPDTFAPGKI
jgi:hypothetical protein